MPLSIVLSYESNAEATQAAPNVDSGDREDAEDAVEALSEPGVLQQPEK